jgi:hypothetical protein
MCGLVASGLGIRAIDAAPPAGEGIGMPPPDASRGPQAGWTQPAGA